MGVCSILADTFKIEIALSMIINLSFGAQRKWCRKTSVFLSRETGMSGNFVGGIKGAKYRFDLQYLTGGSPETL